MLLLHPAEDTQAVAGAHIHAVYGLDISRGPIWQDTPADSQDLWAHICMCSTVLSVVRSLFISPYHTRAHSQSKFKQQNSDYPEICETAEEAQGGPDSSLWNSTFFFFFYYSNLQKEKVQRKEACTCTARNCKTVSTSRGSDDARRGCKTNWIFKVKLDEKAFQGILSNIHRATFKWRCRDLDFVLISCSKQI